MVNTQSPLTLETAQGRKPYYNLNSQDRKLSGEAKGVCGLAFRQAKSLRTLVLSG